MENKEIFGMQDGAVVHWNVQDNPDSLEIGTPSKGGAIKIYGNFNDPVAFQEKITNAMAVREFARGIMRD
jgi:hypothetical protein